MRLNILTAILLLAAVSANADSVYSNLGNPQQFDPSNGWEFDGGVNGGQTVAAQFSLSQTTQLRVVQLALGVVFSDLSLFPVQVSLYSDSSGTPGTDLVDLTGSPLMPFPPGSLNSFTCSTCPTMNGGTLYWLVVSNPDSASLDGFNSAAEWNWNTNLDYATGSNLAFGSNAGGGWSFAPSSELRPAFGINTPEPASWMLMALGLGSGLVLRRRRLA